MSENHKTSNLLREYDLRIFYFLIYFASEKYGYPVFRILKTFTDICEYLWIFTNILSILFNTSNFFKKKYASLLKQTYILHNIKQKVKINGTICFISKNIIISFFIKHKILENYSFYKYFIFLSLFNTFISNSINEIIKNIL